jgi:hypothetical protein
MVVVLQTPDLDSNNMKTNSRVVARRRRRRYTTVFTVYIKMIIVDSRRGNASLNLHSTVK